MQVRDPTSSKHQSIGSKHAITLQKNFGGTMEEQSQQSTNLGLGRTISSALHRFTQNKRPVSGHS